MMEEAREEEDEAGSGGATVMDPGEGSSQAAPQPGAPCGPCGKRPRLDFTDTRAYRSSLLQSCEAVCGGAVVLQQVSPELFITEGLRSEVSVQHEETQMEVRSKSVPGAAVGCGEVFEGGAGRGAVLTVGVAGAGKTSSVLKLCVDWARGPERELVLLSFTELGLVSRGRYSLMELLRVLHPALGPLSAQALRRSKVLFVCDGLDESRLTLDFSCEVVSEVTQRSEVGVLLVNLIRGDLLPDALIWITSRPAAAAQIPARCVLRVTEVRGFSERQKENFFRSRFSDEERLQTVLSHLRTSRGLRTMSQIPVFCCIAATVLEHVLRTPHSGLPQTLTDLYAHFLSLQTQDREEDDCELLLKLGRLAFQQLLKGNVTFFQEDLQRLGLRQASGLCSEILRRQSVLSNKDIFCFVHLSLQEFLAALHVLHCFNTNNNKELKGFVKDLGPNSTVDVFLRKALQKALSSPSGHLDLFVRFLHGLTLESNQRLLGDLLGPSQSDSETRQTLINNLKKMKTKASPDRSINLFHCLTELHDHSLQQQVQKVLKGDDRGTFLSVIQCSALAHELQTSEQVLEQLDLQSFISSDEGRLRLVPAVRNCTQALLCDCKLSKIHLEIVASALSTCSSRLRVLDLSKNPEVNSEMQALCEGLRSPNCRLESLSLQTCGLTESSCSALASALKVNPSQLKVLDLKDNPDLGDAGAGQLCLFLQSPESRLEKLSLKYCRLTEEGCSALASALKSNPSHLRELDVQGNRDLQDPGVEQLCGFLRGPECRLEVLSLYRCDLSSCGCSSLASALKSNPSFLRDLDVGANPEVGDSGVELLCGVLQSPDCRLEVLRLRHCGLSAPGCSSLASALRSNPSHLRHLDLWANALRDTDLQELLELKQSPHCRLEELPFC